MISLVLCCVIMMTVFIMDIVTGYFDCDGDFDSYPDVYGFIETDD